ncbi:hypothetical protein PLICRDRAFT_34198 [Plicaturopsis crispa FD-325 SS-3]|nr:hypothetical protein PLICRDRAFT_34198 [Plicaturopsis crispa FD-325 SS-3]
MSVSRALRVTPWRRRAFISSLFAFTFLATVVTVSASNVLPCPARPARARFADDGSSEKSSGRATAVIEKRPRRWIEERHPHPNSKTCQS